MIRQPIVLLVALAGCFESHAKQQQITGEDCYVCHKPDYEATSTSPKVDIPPHVETGFPTTCADCHLTSDWQPALAGLHPAPNMFVNATGKNDTFLLAKSPHDDIKCLGCHDLALGAVAYNQPPPSRGFNTNCIQFQCHPDDSVQRAGHPSGTVSPYDGTTPYAYQTAVPSFCRDCHHEGLASNHPDTAFPRTDHHAVPCGDCHIRADGPDTGGINASCIESGCHHTLDRIDGSEGHTGSHFTNDRDNPPPPFTAKNFCRDCHPRGNGGG